MEETLKNLNFIDQHNLMIKSICNLLKDKKTVQEWKEGTGTDLDYTTKHDIIVFDEMQNCFFYDGFYELLDLNLKDLSMGMSADYQIAIAFGATHVRVGTAIFGER